jgi:AraC family transcriptional regulator
LHDARRQVKRAFGLFRDNPQTTPAELMRYDACVQMTPGWVADQEAGIGRQTLAGGTYAVHTHVGSYGSLGGLFSQLHREFVPRQGLSVDYDRAFLAIHLNDPQTTREVHRRTELCVPVIPLPMAMRGESEGNQDEFGGPLLRLAGALS